MIYRSQFSYLFNTNELNWCFHSCRHTTPLYLTPVFAQKWVFVCLTNYTLIVGLWFSPTKKSKLVLLVTPENSTSVFEWSWLTGVKCGEKGLWGVSVERRVFEGSRGAGLLYNRPQWCRGDSHIYLSSVCALLYVCVGGGVHALVMPFLIWNPSGASVFEQDFDACMHTLLDPAA